MTSKVNEKSENATIINDVVLTKTALNRLIEFQDRDNEGIRSIRESMADAVCIIVNSFDYYGREEDKEKAQRVIIDLSIIRDWFDDLKKP